MCGNQPTGREKDPPCDKGGPWKKGRAFRSGKEEVLQTSLKEKNCGHWMGMRGSLLRKSGSERGRPKEKGKPGTDTNFMEGRTRHVQWGGVSDKERRLQKGGKTMFKNARSGKSRKRGTKVFRREKILLGGVKFQLSGSGEKELLTSPGEKGKCKEHELGKSSCRRGAHRDTLEKKKSTAKGGPLRGTQRR